MVKRVNESLRTAESGPPIVITLKKRLGPSKLVDDADEGDAERSGPENDDNGAVESARSRSRSRSSGRRSPTPLSPLRAPAMAQSSVLNTRMLEDILTNFHGQLENWIQTETGKLERAESRGNAARESLKRCADHVCGFLREQAPRIHSDLGTDPDGDSFASTTLPRFIEFLLDSDPIQRQMASWIAACLSLQNLLLIDEDRRALQEATSVLNAFTDRRFSKNEELQGLKDDASPVPLLKALLRVLAAQPKETQGRHRRAQHQKQAAPPPTQVISGGGGQSRSGSSLSGR